MFPRADGRAAARALQPDVHCKGTDYTVDTVPEREVVQRLRRPHRHRRRSRRIIRRAICCRAIARGRDVSGSRFLIVRLGSLGDVVHAHSGGGGARARYPDGADRLARRARYTAVLELVPVIDRRLIIVRSRRRAAALLAWQRSAAARVHATTSRSICRGCSSRRCWRGCRARARDRLLAAHLREPAGAAVLHRRVRSRRGGMYDPRDVARHRENLALLRARRRRRSRDRVSARQVARRSRRTVRDAVGRPATRDQSRRGVAEQALAAGALRRARRGARERHGLRSLVLWGPGEEALARRGRRRRRAAPRNCRRRPTIADLVALAGRAALMVSGDTGPAAHCRRGRHADRRLFGPTCPERNGPWSPDDVTRLARCVCAVPPSAPVPASAMCLLDIDVDEVSLARRSMCWPGRHVRRRADAAARRWRVSACRSDSCSARSACALAHPTPRSLARWPAVVAIVGEAIRFWAAGHLEKAREVTRRGRIDGARIRCMWAHR